ncbi:hypothetical protein GCM10027454_03880 [Algoriphagus aestuariicola]
MDHFDDAFPDPVEFGELLVAELHKVLIYTLERYERTLVTADFEWILIVKLHQLDSEL